MTERKRSRETLESPVFHEGGHDRAYQTSGVDDLAEREALLSEAERVAHMGSWVWDLATGRVVWSEELHRIMGYEPGSVVPSTDLFYERIHPDDLPRLMETQRRSLSRRRGEEMSLRLVRPDGEIRHVLLAGSALRDERGETVRFVGTVLDVSESQAAARTTREALETLEHAERVGRTGSFRWTMDGNLVSWSRGLCMVLGLDPDAEHRVETFEALIADSDRSRYLQARDRFARTFVTESLELEVVRPDGQRRVLVFESEPWRDERGEVIGVVGTCLDITERKELERQILQAQKMEALGRLAAGVAHDFNNILAVIMASADVLGRTGAEHSLEEITDAVESGAALTRQLLVLAREVPSEKASLDLNRHVQEVLQLMDRVLGDDVRVRFHPEPRLHPVLGDAVQMRQVLMNLAVNARDAMPRGGVLTIETRNEPAVEGTNMVSLRVADTGEGIAREKLGKIFDPFFTTKSPDVGTGLGLSTVAAIIDSHGGRVEVESTPGSGASFHILLPAEGATVTAEPRSDDSAPDGTGECILVVEDNTRLRGITALSLRSAGYEVLEAEDGDDAITQLDAHGGVALVLTDIELPGARGDDLAATLTDGDDPPAVLYISGRATRPSTPTHVPTGYLVKPFRRVALLAEVRRLLDERTARTQR